MLDAVAMTDLANSSPLALLPALGGRCWFAGINLAPNENYETGLALVNRERQLYRTDKLYSDTDILTAISGIQPAESLIVAMDLPKNMNMSSRFRQEAVRMHPMRSRPGHHEGTLDRFATRVWGLYQAMTESGALVVLYSQQQAKMGYKIFNPYRSRSPAGCRALQTLIAETLCIKTNSTNMVPSSVLDAMVGSYTAWLVWKGTSGEDFDLGQDDAGRWMLEALRTRPEDEKPALRRRFYRPRYR
jgi:hypothetical protein